MLLSPTSSVSLRTGKDAFEQGELPPNNPPGFWRSWIIFFGLLVVIMSIWSLATPLFSGPDEPVQVVKAAAVARGEWLGKADRSEPAAFRIVKVPYTYAQAVLENITSCYADHPVIPAGCAPELVANGKVVAAPTYVGRYPPLYYAIVGLPAKAINSTAGLYLMRLLSAFLAAAVVALSFACVIRWSTNPMLIGGVALAMSPMVLYTASIVNPSGLEIALAITCWTAAIVLGVEHRSNPPPGLVITLVGSASLLCLIRGLSPLWVLIIGVTILVLTSPTERRMLLRKPYVKVGASVVVACALLATAWIIWAGSLQVAPVGLPVPSNLGTFRIFQIALSRSSAYLAEAVGTFGDLWTKAPGITYIIWYVCLALAVAAALTVATVARKQRQGIALVLVITLSILLPAVLSTSRAHIDGIVWQGRDGLPLYVGIPLLAAATSSFSKSPKPKPTRAWTSIVLPLILGALAIGQLAAYGGTLRRFMVGTAGPLDFLESVKGGWSPPVPAAVLLCLFLASLVVWVRVGTKAVIWQSLHNRYSNWEGAEIDRTSVFSQPSGRHRRGSHRKNTAHYWVSSSSPSNRRHAQRRYGLQWQATNIDEGNEE
ncbi:MAG: DUF2142 domain-containing protein [Actinobacteria bacterium]|nr:DUF2142 domain-containing protein [Actinomycetota bacterium]MCL6095747.1 DUF2142 domain-containing protein [Actinomycetota bacterium]